MKKAALILLTSLLISSCKKDNSGGSPTPVKPKIDNTQIGETVKAVITTQDVGLWNFSVTEYDANTKDAVLHMDTTLRGSFSYQFSPHVNNTVLLTATVNDSTPPLLDFKAFDGSAALTDFIAGTDFESLNFTAK